MKNLNLETLSIHFPCPACDAGIAETVAELRKSLDVVCPTCGKPMTLDANEFQSRLAALERMVQTANAA